MKGILLPRRRRRRRCRRSIPPLWLLRLLRRLPLLLRRLGPEPPEGRLDPLLDLLSLADQRPTPLQQRRGKAVDGRAGAASPPLLLLLLLTSPLLHEWPSILLLLMMLPAPVASIPVPSISHRGGTVCSSALARQGVRCGQRGGLTAPKQVVLSTRPPGRPPRRRHPVQLLVQLLQGTHWAHSGIAVECVTSSSAAPSASPSVCHIPRGITEW